MLNKNNHRIHKAGSLIIFTILGALSSYIFCPKVKSASDLAYEQRKGFSSARVHPGTILDIGFSVENKIISATGIPSEDAQQVFAEINLPRHMDFDWEKAKDCKLKLGTDNVIVCDLADIKVNSKKYKNISFKVKEEPSSCSQDMELRVKILSRNLDPNLTNNISQSYRVSTICADNKLYVPTSHLKQVSLDEKFYYTMVVGNESNAKNPYSNDNSYAVSTETLLPVGMQFLESSIDSETKKPHCNYFPLNNNSVICDFNKLSNGEIKNRRDLLLKVSDDQLCEQDVSITTRVNSRSFDPNPLNSSNTHKFKVSCKGEAMIAHLVPVD
jgi:hypothetical protein